jgi:hypothetical protein
MKRIPYWMQFPWIAVNIVLFSGYAVFDVASFFRPRVVHSFWIFTMYATTVFVNCLIVYGLIMRLSRIHYLIVFVSLLMTMHLLIFIVHPLGMGLAYLGPSRAFYMLFILLLSRCADQRRIGHWILVFNISMACVHVFNIVYFTRRTVRALFRQNDVSQ